MTTPLRLPGFDDLPPVPKAAPAPAPAEASPHRHVQPPSVEPFVVEIVRSARRKRTVGAQLRGQVLRITVPAWMSATDTQKYAEQFAAKFQRSMRTERIDLPARAKALAKQHGLRTPTEIRWVDDMTTRWGSCTAETGVIRLSSRLTPFPDWVLDYVIVHELAHLTEANHSARFWSLVDRYPKKERATGYLIAKSGDDDNEL